MEIEIEKEHQCLHCGERTTDPPNSEGDIFCCPGCEAVWGFLHEKGLSNYYVLSQKSTLLRPREALSSLGREHFLYLDEPDVVDQFAYGVDQNTIRFFLEGVHCSACLWLLEKLPELGAGVMSARLDLGRSILEVSRRGNAKFSEIAILLSRMGYRPHPYKPGGQHEGVQKKLERKELIRLGVSAALTGNIMLFSVSLYGGAAGHWEVLFNWLVALLAVPVLSWGAFPFFRNALSSLKQKSISIDLTVALAIIGGLFALAFGRNYLDSLCMLVTLLLASRFSLHGVQTRALRESSLFPFLFSGLVRRIRGSEEFRVPVDSIKTSDVLRLGEGETIPVDGRIQQGFAEIDNSVLTGETRPILFREGEEVVAGGRVLSGAFQIEALSTARDSRMGQLLQQIEAGHYKKAPFVGLSDKVARWYVGLAGLVAAFTAVYFSVSGAPLLGIERGLVILIVACPCVLAFSVPFIFSLSLSLASKKGILIKDSETLERLTKIRTIVFDKTGTLTMGCPKTIGFRGETNEDLRQAVFSLESRSRHPVARALREWAQAEGNLRDLGVEEFREIPGRGVFGSVLGVRWGLRAVELNSSSPNILVGVEKDGEFVGFFELEDHIRSEVPQVISELKKKNFKLFILSGDRPSVVEKMCEKLVLPLSSAVSGVGPEEKAKWIVGQDRVLMVGDGANDAAAFRVADVGIAVQGSLEISLRAADIYLTSGGLDRINLLLKNSGKILKTAKGALMLSVFYNCVSIVGAFQGWITPMVAAVIMPTVSTVVFIYSWRRMVGIWR